MSAVATAEDGASGDILVLSSPCGLYGWTLRYLGHVPQTTGSREQVSRLAYVFDYVEPLRDCWVYELREDVHSGKVTVASEIRVDADGACCYTARLPILPAVLPIPDRATPEVSVGRSGHSVQFLMTDEGGRALRVRLLYSQYRLPSATLAALQGPKYRRAVARCIPPLWEWARGHDDEADINSSNGYHVVYTDLWLDPDGDSEHQDPARAMRVWVATNPFAIAERRSDIYVGARNAYLDAYEPRLPSARRELERTMLARSLTASILENAGAHEKYAGLLRVSHINEWLDADDERRTRLIRASERTGAALCKVLDSPLFELMQRASLDLEGWEDAEVSEFLVEHLRVLGKATRMVSDCRSGRALVASWVEEAEKHPEHFLNHAVLPASNVAPQHFKAFRWSSKAMVNLVAEVFAHRVRLRRLPTKVEVGKLIEPLLRIYMPGFDPVHHLADVKFAQEMVKDGKLNLETFEVVVKKTGVSRPELVDFLAADPAMKRLAEEWLEAGKPLSTGMGASLLDAKFAAGALIDGINVLLAINAVESSEGGRARTKAVLDAGAAGVGLVVTLAEEIVRLGGGRAELAVSKAWTLFGAKLLVGAYYGFWDARGAAEAFRKGDDDSGFCVEHSRSCGDRGRGGSDLGRMRARLTGSTMGHSRRRCGCRRGLSRRRVWQGRSPETVPPQLRLG